MARRYTNLSDRIVYIVSTGLIKAQGTTVTLYKDYATTVRANLAYYDPANASTPGSAVTGGVLAVDAYSLRQGFWDLDDLDGLFMVAGSSGPVEPIYPDPQPLLAAEIAARIAGQAAATTAGIGAAAGLAIVFGGI